MATLLHRLGKNFIDFLFVHFSKIFSFMILRKSNVDDLFPFNDGAILLYGEKFVYGAFYYTTARRAGYFVTQNPPYYYYQKWKWKFYYFSVSINDQIIVKSGRDFAWKIISLLPWWIQECFVVKFEIILQPFLMLIDFLFFLFIVVVMSPSRKKSLFHQVLSLSSRKWLWLTFFHLIFVDCFLTVVWVVKQQKIAQSN